MTALAAAAARSEVTLDIPRLLIAAAQPYVTVAGPALSVNFLHQPALLPFQSIPFHNSSVAPLYFHTLLHSLAEFAETPRPSRSTHVKIVTPPKEDFWRSVGTLNCFYCTAHEEAVTSTSSSSPSEMSVEKLSAHPTMGAVELVRSSSRAESDVKLTLFNEGHVPVMSMLMTGPKESLYLDPSATSSGGGAGSTSTLVRNPLPPVENAASDEDAYMRVMQFYYDSCDTHRMTAVPGSYFSACAAATAACSGTLESVRLVGGLYGPLEKLKDGSYAHRACFASPEASTTTNSTPSEDSSAQVKDASSVSALSTPQPLLLPPWLLYSCVTDLCTALSASGAFGSHPALARISFWRVCAHHAVVSGDAVAGVPLDVVCAPPKCWERYRLPPWRRQLGLPALSGEVPCVALLVEFRQDSLVVATGTFFMVPLDSR